MFAGDYPSRRLDAMPRVKLSLERKIVAGFGAALMAMAIVGVSAWWITDRLDETFRRVDQSHRVLYRLEASVTELLGLQGDLRAYLLTGDEKFLARSSTGGTIIRDSLAILAGLVADNPEQSVRLEALVVDLNRTSQLVRQLLTARREQQLGSPGAIQIAGEFDRSVDSLREQISEMERQERQLLDIRSRAVRQATTVTTAAVIGTASLAAMLLVAGIIVVRRDFARRKVAEGELQETSARYEDLYQRAPCGYHSIDRHGVFVAMNETELGWLGYRREEVIGRLGFADLCTPASRRKFETVFPHFLEAGEVQNLEFDLMRKDGTVLPVLLSATMIRDANGSFVATRSMMFDATARREADLAIHTLNENLQRQNAALESVNRELEAFSYSVSHDLRAPLRHIDGFCGLLSREYGTRLDATGHHYLQTISGGAKQMGRLIDDLLSLSRIGRASLRRSPVVQDALVADILRSHRREAGQRPIEWRVDGLPTVDADPTLLRQVWINLIDNAVKYSRKSARPCIEIGGTAALASGEHVFYVRDNGVGFDMKYAAKLFGAFQRLHSSSEFEGSGIGLANVRRIVARHGGRTWAEGRVGAGATFYFSLPTAAQFPDAGATTNPLAAA